MTPAPGNGQQHQGGDDSGDRGDMVKRRENRRHRQSPKLLSRGVEGGAFPLRTILPALLSWWEASAPGIKRTEN